MIVSGKPTHRHKISKTRLNAVGCIQNFSIYTSPLSTCQLVSFSLVMRHIHHPTPRGVFTPGSFGGSCFGSGSFFPANDRLVSLGICEHSNCTRMWVERAGRDHQERVVSGHFQWNLGAVRAIKAN